MKFPAGKYTARAVADSHRMGKSTQKGTDYSSVDCEIITPEGFAGQTIGWTGYWTEKAAEYTAKALRVMGWSDDDIEAAKLAGLGSTEFELVIEGEEGRNGQTYSKIKYVNPLLTSLDDSQRKSLGMKFHQQIQASRNGTPPTQAPPPTDEKGDDIPF